MNSTKKALIAAAVAVVFAGGLIFWQVKARKTGPVELTADDMTVLAAEPGYQRLCSIYLGYIRELLANPPGPEWDAAFTLYEK